MFDEELVTGAMEAMRQGEFTPVEVFEAVKTEYLRIDKKQRLPMIVAVRNYPAPEGSDAFSWLRKKNTVADSLIKLADEQEPTKTS